MTPEQITIRPLNRAQARRTVDLEKKDCGWTYHGTLGFLQTILIYLFREEAA